MAKVIVYNWQGEVVGDVQLDDALFCVKANPALVHEAVVAQMANNRVVFAHVKDRGEVAGSGKKPWKQKGTGRARHGSRRSPIWVGGGVTFGPQHNRNFSKKINKQTRRRALAMVLSDKVANGNLIALASFDLPQAKTKLLFSGLKKLPKAGQKSLLVLGKNEEQIVRIARNLSGVSIIPADSLNVIDVLKSERLVVSKEGIEIMTKTFGRKNMTPASKK